jgi:hypothetical protein
MIACHYQFTLPTTIKKKTDKQKNESCQWSLERTELKYNSRLRIDTIVHSPSPCRFILFLFPVFSSSQPSPYFLGGLPAASFFLKLLYSTVNDYQFWTIVKNKSSSDAWLPSWTNSIADIVVSQFSWLARQHCHYLALRCYCTT